MAYCSGSLGRLLVSIKLILAASDGRGGVVLQHFQLIVAPPNTPPRFVSVPTPGSVAWDLPYQFPVRGRRMPMAMFSITGCCRLRQD